jgi:hypothetical protein
VVKARTTTFLLALVACRPLPPESPAPAPEDPHRARLGALYEEIMAKTRAREAWSPVKNERLGLDWEAESERIAPLLFEARNDRELFYALVLLSNARRDRHLFVAPAEGGLQVPEADTDPLHAPVAFMTDYGDMHFFVADFARDLENPPTIGDRVVGVDGLEVKRWISQQKAWYRYSTIDYLWWHLGDDIARSRRGEGPPLRDERLRVELEDSRRHRYSLSLPFMPEDEIDWVGHAEPKYPGFEAVLDTESGTLFAPTDNRRVVLMQWKRFGTSLLADLDLLMGKAEKLHLLDHDLVVDLTNARGGDGSAWAVQRFVDRRFKGTFGNIRVSDVLPAFIEEVRSDDWDEPTEYGVLQWLETDVSALDGGYSENVPFKLFHMGKDADGWFEPAPVHFRGRLACIFGPQGGSNLDQFGAMVVDNDLGLTVGMPLGGYSNTWEFTETLHMPQTGEPLVEYMWSIGHTIRPSGEVLEGNPAEPEIRIPLTAENFASYHDVAITAILDAWH